MKKILMLMPFILFWGCNQGDKQNSDSANAQKADSGKTVTTPSLASIIAANMNKTPIIDTAFLGFTFNMSKKQAEGYFSQLIKSGRVVKDESGEHYVYPLAFDVIKTNALLAPDYQDDKLYSITLIISPVDDIATDKTVFYQVALAYMKKYNNSNGFTSYQDADPLESDLKEYHWVKNNLHIYLRNGINGTLVSYSNTPVEQQVEKNKKTQADSSKTQTSKDI